MEILNSNPTYLRIGFDNTHSWFPANRVTVNDSLFGFQAGTSQQTFDILTGAQLSNSAAIALLQTDLTTLTDGYTQFKNEQEAKVDLLESKTVNLEAGVNALEADLADNYASINGQIGTINSNISTRNTIVDNFLEASAESVTTLESTLNGNVSTLEDSISVVSDIVSSEADKTSTLTSNFNGNAASVNTQLNTLVTNYQATSTSLAALRSEFDNNSVDIETRLIAVTNDTSSQASSITSLQAQYAGLNQSVSDYQNEVQLLSDAEQAFSSHTESLKAFYLNKTQNLETTIDSQEAVVAGMFKEWNGIDTPEIGNINIDGEIVYQFLGGTLGANLDGWVRTDLSAKNYTDAVIAIKETRIHIPGPGA